MSNQTAKVDIDYTNERVPQEARRGFLKMFMIMMGFTFFSASMWVGQKLAEGLDFQQFIGALVFGGALLGAYTGALGYVGGESGLSLDNLAIRSFGRYGSYLPSAMISFTQMGWFGVGLAMFAIPVATQLLGGDKTVEYALVALAGVCMTASAYRGIKSLTIISFIAVPCVAILGTIAMVMAVMQGNGSIIEQFAVKTTDLGVVGGAGLVIGSFVSGGSATPNFTRFSKSGKMGCIISIVAFFIGNSLMFCFGAVSSICVVVNDIFDVMLNLNLFYIAILVLGLNIWTTNDNALYSAGLGLANITKLSKKALVLATGLLGTLAAEWLYWNFCGFLNILNCTLPPVGIIIVISYFMHRKAYINGTVAINNVEWGAVAGVAAGAVVANLVPWGIASINGMVVASICYLAGNALQHRSN